MILLFPIAEVVFEPRTRLAPGIYTSGGKHQPAERSQAAGVIIVRSNEVFDSGIITRQEGPMRRVVLLALVTACAPGPPSGETASDEPSKADAQTAVAEVGETSSQAGKPTDIGPVTDVREVAFAPALGVDLASMNRQASGLYIQVLEAGEGPPAAPGDSMGVDYTVWLPHGGKLDSSFDHPTPAPLPMVLGQTRLIDGWSEGVTGMRQGEKRKLVVPYDLAYGAGGRPPQVPPYSALVFEVTLAYHVPRVD